MTMLAVAAVLLLTVLSVYANSNELVQQPGLALAAPRFTPHADSQPRIPDVSKDFELLDIVLVASVDGKFHALNRTSGHPLWSMSSLMTTTSVSAPSSLAPLVRTSHIDHDPETMDDPDDDNPHETYIIEPQSGDIYVMTSPDSPLVRFPFSMAELVDISPFTSTEKDSTRVFVGHKKTSLMLLELETGKIKSTLNSECPIPLQSRVKDAYIDLDDLEDAGTRFSAPTEIYIGRTDYHITIYKSGDFPSPPPQELSFSVYGPNNKDNHLQATYKRTNDGIYLQGLPSGEVMTFKTFASGEDQPVQQTGRALWAQHFQAPVVAVFDILRPLDGPTKPPFALLQPRLNLQELLPSIHLSHSQSHPHMFPNLDKAFVGLVEESGSLFVMSPDRYPLVVFGGSGRRIGDGPLSSTKRRKTIDDGNSKEGGGISRNSPPYGDPEADYPPSTVPPSVDDLNQLRKLKEEEAICAHNPYDKRCMVGVRKVEDGDGHERRMQRLIDGPSSTLTNTPTVVGKSGIPLPVTNQQPQQWPEGPQPPPTVLGPSGGASGADNASGRVEDHGRAGTLPGDGRVGSGSGGGGFTSTKLEAVLITLLFGLVSTFLVWLKVKSPSPSSGLSPSTLVPDGHLKPVNDERGMEEMLTSVLNGNNAWKPGQDRTGKEQDSGISLALPKVGDGAAVPPPVPPKDTIPISSPPVSSNGNLNGAGSPAGSKEAHVAPPSRSATPTPGQRPPAPVPSRADSTGSAKGSASLAGIPAAGEEGEESEGEMDVGPEKKKKARRGNRGKKKKKGTVIVEEAQQDEKETPEPTPTPPPAPSLVVTTTSPKPPPTPSLVVSDTILGRGSHGTVVLQGSLQGRAVAVKRLLQDFVTLAAREVSILQESDDHPNVIRYYYQEAQGNFLYIALELCICSLADLIEQPNREEWRDIAVSFDRKKALRQITSGLRHLHGLKLIHRDIKPQNILISSSRGSIAASSSVASRGGGAGYRMLISDFGLCKKLDMDQTSFLPTAHGAMAAGSVGWRAPEILRGDVKLDEEMNEDGSLSSRGSNATISGGSAAPTQNRTRLTKSVDIFALGCLFYYTLTSGSHPFGDRIEREFNIMKNEKDLGLLDSFGEEGTEAKHLILSMIDPVPRERPDTTTALLHPFFWDPGRRLNFLQDASDRFEILCREPKDARLLVLEENGPDIVGNDWHSRLDRIFIENLGKYRKYDGKLVQDLLRALRNKKHHYQDLPDNVKRHLGSMPDGFLAYFTRRYPNLILHVHQVIRETGFSAESMFRNYFELPDQ